MRIQNNIMAMNTHRFYTANNNAVSKSAEKLSSGYRVNRAGDDAAGLAISEKMRAEIRGLSMASKNSQDGVSMVQTAEGALTEVQAMLQRMKELAVQAASDSNEDEIDRPALDQEFQQLIKEIDDVAKTTTFNDMKLLDGSFTNKVIQIGSRTGNEMEISIGNMDAASLGLAEVDDAPTLTGIEVEVTNPGVDAKDATTDEEATQEISVNLANVTAEDGKIVTIKSGTNVIGTLEYEDDTSTWSWTDGANVPDGYEGAWDADTGKVTLTATAVGEKGAPALTGTLTAEYDGTGTATATVGTFTDGSEEAEAVEAEAAVFTVTADSASLTDAEGNALTSGKITLSVGGSELTVNVEGTGTDGAITDADVANAFEGKSVTIGDFKFEAAVTDNVVTFTAVEEGNVAEIDENDTENYAGDPAVDPYAGAIVNLENQDNASEAIDICRDALNQVSTQRAELGAIQNRLEHKISNLDNTVENVSAAEARIRDVDIAKEMTNFTKNQILSQAATAMLAQANSLPQNVLSLLQ